MAHLAGVSRATVSRVVNGSTRVRPDVVELVQRAVTQLNYVPNRAARSLAAQRTMSIALVVPEDAHRFFSDPYFADIVQGIDDRLETSEYVLTLLLAHPRSPSDKTRRYLLGGNVDGALVVSHHSGDHFLSELARSLPVVFGGRPMGPVARADDHYVDVDNHLGAVLATRHLLEAGGRNVATVAGPEDMPAALDREQGWRDTLREAGLASDRLIRGDFTEVSGVRAGLSLLDRWPDTDAVFVANDLMASGVMLAFAERGVAVPDDVALVGFDDSPYAVRGPLGLTTIDQRTREMGGIAADMLLRRLAGEPVEPTQVLAPRLVVRESSLPAPSRTGGAG
ncbi:LacI family DNA-binding transcriptional regulator [Phycicoccus sp. CSK15P-2]|uniref:LacI family DNA-binding transcriptional regulator n=1 Tax=Phycicoccus sp. CSK15P-2 TaxID=2807627 RepID=UPI0027DD8A21|nr:LacI family DNA-binding transcriptional regulator [Phycicoccus sp. CSK15P-2]